MRSFKLNLITVEVETDVSCQTNVTLYCDVVSGNPRHLRQVKWFMDGLLLNELPQCGGKEEDLCDVDPSKLLLESVNRHFSGNFSCSGVSRAGTSQMSPNTPLTVRKQKIFHTKLKIFHQLSGSLPARDVCSELWPPWSPPGLQGSVSQLGLQSGGPREARHHQLRLVQGGWGADWGTIV